MQEELKYMQDNDLWNIVELPVNFKQTGYKLIFKTKIRGYKRNIKCFKARFFVKGFNQLETTDLVEHFHRSQVMIYSEFMTPCYSLQF